MTDLFFTLIIIALLTGFFFYIREQERKTSKLINALLSKDTTDYVSRTLAENTQIKPEVNGNTNPDLISMEQLDDDAFDAHIKATLDNKLVDQEVV